MSKNRFTNSDTKAMVRDVRGSLLGQRLANVYDLDEKTYLFKFAVPGESEKVMLLLESGRRFHTTKYSRELPGIPSPFAAKLRKFLRTKRLEEIRQLGNDRVIILQFGVKESTNYLILEMYANGNIVMTDSNFEILALLRSHKFEEGVNTQVGEIYPLLFSVTSDVFNINSGISSNCSGNHATLSAVADSPKDSMETGAIGAIGASDVAASEISQDLKVSEGVLGMDIDAFARWGWRKIDDGDVYSTVPSNNKKKVKAITLRQLLLFKDSGAAQFGPEIVEHCILTAGLQPNMKVETFLSSTQCGAQHSRQEEGESEGVRNTEQRRELPGDSLRASAAVIDTKAVVESNAITDAKNLTQQSLHRLQAELRRAPLLVRDLDVPGMPGYILAKPTPLTAGNAVQMGAGSFAAAAGSNSAALSADTGSESENMTSPVTALEYVEFLPQLYAQHRAITGSPASDGNASSTSASSSAKVDVCTTGVGVGEGARGLRCLEFSSFNEAVDEYFCRLEEQRLARNARNAEETARKKILKVKTENERLLTNLAQQQEKMERGAMLLEVYADEVDKVSLVLNSALGSGMTWDGIGDMVEAERARGNPIASLVRKLFLEKNRVVLALRDIYSEEDGEEKEEEEEGTVTEESDESGVPEAGQGPSKLEQKQRGERGGKGKKSESNAGVERGKVRGRGKLEFVEVEIDLALSAHANSRAMYAQKKAAHGKEVKTATASGRALRAVEEQTMKALEKQKIRRNLQAVRKVHWFEKFNWFITTEGYLVLSGRDAQQNEALCRRYLRPGDVYVHADMKGAASCIVRAKSIPSSAGKQIVGINASRGGRGGDFRMEGDIVTKAAKKAVRTPFSPIAIQEAGAMAVCRSAAWSGKIVTSAWWVWADQVSKTPPTGEYLSTGGFMIYGKKNYLPPLSLEMGFGIMFRLDDSSVLRHANDRKDRSSAYGRDGDDGGGEGGVEGGSTSEWDADQEDVVSASGSVSASATTTGAREEDDTTSILNENFEKYSLSIDTFLPPLPPVSAAASLPPSEGAASTLQAVDGSDAKVSVATGSIDRSSGSVRDGRENSQVEEEESEDNDDAGSVDVLLGEGGEGEEEESKRTGNSMLPPPEGRRQKYLSSNSGQRGDPPSSEDILFKSDRRRAKKGQSVAPASLIAQQRTSKDSNVGPSGKSDPSSAPGEDSIPSAPLKGSSVGGKKKVLNKKKARRYAEQDDEDRELAMAVLGHNKKREIQTAKIENEKNHYKSIEERQHKVGVSKNLLLLSRDRDDSKNSDHDNNHNNNSINNNSSSSYIYSSDWNDSFQSLPHSVQEFVHRLIEEKELLRAHDLSSLELRSLATFPEDDAMKIMKRFVCDQKFRKSGRKSALLANIMRDYRKSAPSLSPATPLSLPLSDPSSCLSSTAAPVVKSSTDSADGEHPPSPASVGDEKNGVGSEELDKQEHAQQQLLLQKQQLRHEKEVHAILEDEGVLEEEEGRLAEDINKLTGIPQPEDIILYAIPVCAPYMTLQSFKYKVKLIPGTMKKGKAAKLALDLFTKSREATAEERSLVKNVTDPEAVAVMIGDVKVSMPGLQQVLKQQAKQQQHQKKKSNANRGQKK